MKAYHQLLQHILDHGNLRTDRTGTGTLGVFGYQMHLNLKEGFPLLTTKKIHIPSVVHELLWFLRGDMNIQYLKEHKVSIWDEWADEQGNLGPVYGKQWRSWETNQGTIDQIQQVIDLINNQPDSRRMLVSAWNVADIPTMKLPPCHCLFQFYVSNNELSCQLYQRSADAFLGVPFNIASYALLTHIIASICGLEVGTFVHTFGDLHIYTNHMEQVKLQLSRTPDVLPQLNIKRKHSSINDYVYEDFEFLNYHPQAAIKAPVAI